MSHEIANERVIRFSQLCSSSPLSHNINNVCMQLFLTCGWASANNLYAEFLWKSNAYLRGRSLLGALCRQSTGVFVGELHTLPNSLQCLLDIVVLSQLLSLQVRFYVSQFPLEPFIVTRNIIMEATCMLLLFLIAD